MIGAKISYAARCTAILLSLVFILTALSCSDKVTDNPAGEMTTEVTDTAESTGPVRPDLPQRDYEGYKLVIMERAPDSSGWWASTDVFTEGLTGDPLNDALYNRNEAVSKWMNITIEPYTVADGNFVTTLNKSIAAGDNSCDLAMLTLATAFSAAQNGYLYPLNDSPYINMDASYYTKTIFKDTSVYGKNYFAVGDMTIISTDGTWILMFNKIVAQNYHLEDLYQLVRDGVWTVDKFYSLMKDSSGDTDGNSIYDEHDNYGFATSDDSYAGLFYGMGGSVISKETDDSLILTGVNEQIVDIVDKTVTIMNNETITFNNSKFPAVGWKGIQIMFEAGQVLFYGEVLQCVRRLRAMDTDFGVLPFPKYNEPQETYTSYIHSWASDALTIPRCTPDQERSEIIFEALAYESQVFLRPAYYDITLKTKAMRDDESGEMLDIILAGRKVDIGYIANVGNVWSFIVGQMSSSQGKIASNFAMVERAATVALDKVNNSFLEITEK
jgi:ABC-type glycerol-3-phosphate transport system substrate-binding protein